MNKPTENRCPNCFEPGPMPLCSHCGFNCGDYLEEARHLPLFSVIGGQYTTGRVLGAGGFAIVYIAQKAGEKQLFAIKEYYPEQLAARSRSGYSIKPKSGAEKKQWFDTCYRRFVEEAKLLEKCQKYPAIPGIVRYTDLIQQHDTAYLVMEYVEGCSLYDLWWPQQKLPFAQIKPWLQPLLETLEQLHRREIYHRDISLKNIFLRGGPKRLVDPVLMDFGLARSGVRESHMQSSVIGVGTPEYLAPEQSANSTDTGIDARTDLYSLGAVLFHCLEGVSPPPVEARRHGAPLVFSRQDLEPALKAAVMACLALSKKDRPEHAAALKNRLDPLFARGTTLVPDNGSAFERPVDPALLKDARQAEQKQAAPKPPIDPLLKKNRKPIRLKTLALAVLFLLLFSVIGYWWVDGQGQITRIMAELGDSDAQYRLGQRYDDAAWYRRAAEQGHADAQFNLGVSYANGSGVQQDDKEAVAWYRKAAEQGQASAQFNLGVSYANGRGVQQDDQEAVAWYRKAADQGYANAQYSLGWRYDKGRGVRQDDQEAAAWYRKAAEQGYSWAQLSLGDMYRDGKGVQRDDREAAAWYRKAAEQGHKWAQLSLGDMYRDGKGVQRDDREAAAWYLKALEQGLESAEKRLNELNQRNNPE